VLGHVEGAPDLDLDLLVDVVEGLLDFAEPVVPE
jgi:hypothetical protein